MGLPEHLPLSLGNKVMGNSLAQPKIYGSIPKNVGILLAIWFTVKFDERFFVSLTNAFTC